jgi:hypothetical protein
VLRIGNDDHAGTVSGIDRILERLLPEQLGHVRVKRRDWRLCDELKRRGHAVWSDERARR